jgi:hypothetical protein
MIRHLVEYGESYGFAKPPQVEQARRSLDEFVEEIERGLETVLRERDTKGGEEKRSTESRDDERGDALLAQLRGLLSGDRAAKRSNNAEKGVDATIDEFLQLDTSFDVWLEFKALLAERAPDALQRTRRGVISPWRSAPALSYGDDQGFLRDARALLREETTSKSRALLKFGVKPDRESGHAHFLAGWYLVDEGRSVAARPYFINAAESFLRQCRDGDDTDSLLARRNAMIMLVAAASVVDTPPGIDAFRADFLAGLRVQATIWKRRAYAKGMASFHVDAELAGIATEINRISSALRQMAAKRAGRYYFVDYRYRFGAVPDVLVADAIQYGLHEDLPRDGDGMPIKELKQGGEGAAPVTQTKSTLNFEDFVSRCYLPPYRIELDAQWLEGRLRERKGGK